MYFIWICRNGIHMFINSKVDMHNIVSDIDNK